MQKEFDEGSGDTLVDALNHVGYKADVIEDSWEGSGDSLVDALEDEVKEYHRADILVRGDYWNAIRYSRPRRSAMGKMYDIDISCVDRHILLTDDEFKDLSEKLMGSSGNTGV